MGDGDADVRLRPAGGLIQLSTRQSIGAMTSDGVKTAPPAEPRINLDKKMLELMTRKGFFDYARLGPRRVRDAVRLQMRCLTRRTAQLG